MNRNRINHTNTYGHNTVFGDQNAENNFIGYGEGLDILVGGNHNDTFHMTFEYDFVDTVYGGFGTDTVDYSNADRGLTINLLEGIAGIEVYEWDYTLNGPNLDGFEPGDPTTMEVSTILNSIENVVGTAFNDQILGNHADNVIEGGGGADLIYGGQGNDTASYENSSEGVHVWLQGLTGSGLEGQIGFGFGGDANGDQLVSIENVIGSAHNDTFHGSNANNVFEGGGGVDTFVFNNAIGHDTITDFDASGNDHDVIRFEGVFDDWNDLRDHMEDTGDDVVIHLDDHNSITLENVNFNQLGASDFEFV
ncbi:MAG TPA: hypothetical protein VD863_04195 [Bradyrhizobium sp.]|nr:hypothetical protein [Bradyrhizobium sp.]